MRTWQTQVKCALVTVLGLAIGAASVVAPPPAEAADTAAYIAFAAPYAQQESMRYGVPASVSIAQSILESGWGGSSLTSQANNYFGIKCPSTGIAANSGSPFVIDCVAKDSYEYPGPVLIRSWFRAYRTPQDSFLDHGLFLSTRSWYAPAFAYTNDPDQFIREIAKGGYATDPTYADMVISIMRQYNLYRFNMTGTFATLKPVSVPLTPTPSPTPTPTSTATATATPTATASPAVAPALAKVASSTTVVAAAAAPVSPSATPTPSSSASATVRATPTATATPSATATRSATVTPTPTRTATPAASTPTPRVTPPAPSPVRTSTTPAPRPASTAPAAKAAASTSAPKPPVAAPPVTAPPVAAPPAAAQAVEPRTLTPLVVADLSAPAPRGGWVAWLY